jgi:hypothetical protein
MSNDAVLSLLIEVARNDDQVRAVVLGVLRANPALTPDIFSDYDVPFAVTDPSRCVEDHSWIAKLGNLIAMQQNDCEVNGARHAMIAVGSVSRDDAAELFPFLAAKYSGRRAAIKEFTHRDPDFVFWIYPDGRLFNARDSHRKNIPRGFEHILEDEPDYGGFLRGRAASQLGRQLIVVYCREEALAAPGPKLSQFLCGLDAVPIAIQDDTLVVSDNADIYGTVADLFDRAK